ncbi:MAG: carboxylating nicotinate-nucleotide diphosphorylase [Pirellulales bacterium]
MSHTPCAPPVAKDFKQLEWDAALVDDCRQIVRLAVREDLDRKFDWTTIALVPSGTAGEAAIVARGEGVVAGLKAVEVALAEMDVTLHLTGAVADGASVSPGQTLATLTGPARSLLTAERILLNLLGHLSGIATLTRRYVDAVAGTQARIYDTRKTTPGWRRLEKYAVRCGGGHNHRTGLFDAILIKDNHLAVAAQALGEVTTPAQAVERARRLARAIAAAPAGQELIVEVEVDTLYQLEQVLPMLPDIVLLDNMAPAELRRAVELRNRMAANVELEASGGVRLDTVAEIAATGVERISVGALTHAAPALDIGLDWR